MTFMTDLVFVDTNILVYSRDAGEPEKQRTAAERLARLWDDRTGRLSIQVLQEYYVTVTRKLSPGLPVEDAREDVGALRAWRPHVAGLETLDLAWDVEDRYGLSVWDALIVAAAARMNCRTLLTEDLSHGQEYLGVVAENPFLS